MSEPAEYHPEWKPDCGQWNYDCEIVALDSRCWSDGFAMSSICIGDLNNGPYEVLAEEKFYGDSDHEVKAQVEAWAKDMIARVETAVRREFHET